MESAIEVIAKEGYANASLARIARHTGISRGLISYHFAGKDELISRVLVTVFGEVAAYMGPRVEAERTAVGQLRAYIESNLAYMDAHRSRIAAVVEIISGGGLATLGVDPIQAEEESLMPLAELFRRGQVDGEFRAFDPLIMARSVRGVIDSMAPRVTDVDLDLKACARELTTLFELATRNPSRRDNESPDVSGAKPS
ncbi:TetR/AcrR family transcriptional regulator [Phytoactinopolyspora halotolerans]|uniref:TetR/AcrR family transcriptional regulator n=1 Tax=Phytoactinopolyspora halotolerans TaxID=1981512 RepID=UPI001C20858A|nr:TetR/AcrR family transcriptional regulator [Phytoactinopolyspora halotolerans]